jgi:hypothetical protein
MSSILKWKIISGKTAILKTNNFTAIADALIFRHTLIFRKFYILSSHNDIHSYEKVIIMSDMAEARRHMHEREEQRKKDSKSKKMKVKNFFFGCCKNK